MYLESMDHRTLYLNTSLETGIVTRWILLIRNSSMRSSGSDVYATKHVLIVDMGNVVHQSSTNGMLTDFYILRTTLDYF